MLLVSLLLAASVQEPALLTAPPEGWRFERIDFPLSFAPGIDHEGFEELLFAPGMFTPGSDSWFSYALAIRLEEDLSVDEAFLHGFLERYYRGLSETVGASRGLELDLSGFSVDVARRAEGFEATIETIEPFATAEPITLRLELAVHPGARSTEILGLVSPLPADAPVWRDLHAMAGRWREGRPLPLLFNHLFVVADPETYEAFRGSRFLRDEFAVSEERETVRRDVSYSGVYFYGTETYFELLPPGSAGLSAGATGLAFGFEVPGGTARAAEILEEAGIRAFAGSRTRELAGEPVPWFEVMGIEAPTTTTRLSLFSLEYDPRFLDAWHPGLRPEHGGIARAAVLQRYAASLDQGERRRTAPFEDVSELRLALDEAERDRLFDVCRAFGYVVEQREGGWLCDGPGIALAIRESADAGPSGITGFTVRLRRPVVQEPLQLGRCRVVFEDESAGFDFL